MSLKKYHARHFPSRLFSVLLLLVMGMSAAAPAMANPDLTDEQLGRLEAGEVLLDGSIEHKQSGLVEGKILINARPDRVWSVVVNPREFAGKIQKHLRAFTFLKDTPRNSVLDCQVEVSSFLPRINYIVESFYDPCKRIDFRRIGGALRNFYGYWLLEPRDNGNKTLVTYAMYIDPGFFVPQWIMRHGLKRELPQTLNGIRDRVTEIDLQVTPNLAARNG